MAWLANNRPSVMLLTGCPIIGAPSSISRWRWRSFVMITPDLLVDLCGILVFPCWKRCTYMYVEDGSHLPRVCAGVPAPMIMGTMLEEAHLDAFFRPIAYLRRDTHSRQRKGIGPPPSSAGSDIRMLQTFSACYSASAILQNYCRSCCLYTTSI